MVLDDSSKCSLYENHTWVLIKIEKVGKRRNSKLEDLLNKRKGKGKVGPIFDRFKKITGNGIGKGNV